MVFVTFVLAALAFGSLASISVFLKPLGAEFGWTRSETSLGFTAIAFSSALFGVLWGFVADKFGSRYLATGGCFMMAVAMYLLSGMDSLLQFYLFYFLFGALGHSTVGAPLSANVGFWFRRNPGLALGVMASGGAVGQGLVPFGIRFILTEYDWQTAYLVMAWTYLLISVPISLLVRESPLRQAARSNSFVDDDLETSLSPIEVMCWIALAIIFCCSCMSVPIVHLVPLMTDKGYDPQTAATVLMVLMLVGGFGRIASGMIADRIGALETYLLMGVLQMATVVWFPHLNSLLEFLLVAFVFGFSFSGIMSAILMCVRKMIPARLAGRGMSIVSLFGWGAMGTGGYLGGLLFDMTGDYVWSFGQASLMGLLNVLVLIAFYLRVHFSKTEMQSLPLNQ